MKTHRLRMPNMTCCGHTGRPAVLGTTKAIVVDGTDNSYRLDEPVTCDGCLRYIERIGAPLDWTRTHQKAHEASVAKEKRRRHRRRRRAH